MSTGQEHRINGWLVSELQPHLSKIQHDIVGLNAIMAIELILNEMNVLLAGMNMSRHLAGPSKDTSLRELTACVIMLKTIVRTIKAHTS
jgi:hypothetical protein